jgi:hypothetical protein
MSMTIMSGIDVPCLTQESLRNNKFWSQEEITMLVEQTGNMT